MAVFLLFLLALATGSLSTLFWIPETDLGRGYFQMNALVVLGLLGLAAAVVLLHPGQPFGAATRSGATLLGVSFGGSFLYYAAITGERWRLGRWPLSLALVACAAALLLSGRALVSTPTPLPHRGELLVAALIVSALLLGWSLVTMLLGHWYLVAPRLTFRHLVVFCWVLLAIVLARAAAVAVSLTAAAGVAEIVDPHPLRLVVGFAGQGMFFWFRVAWGLVGPAVLAVMALQCARQRSNQSATGILYVLVVGTFIGEITGLYLTVTTGVPV